MYICTPTPLLLLQDFPHHVPLPASCSFLLIHWLSLVLSISAWVWCHGTWVTYEAPYCWRKLTSCPQKPLSANSSSTRGGALRSLPWSIRKFNCFALVQAATVESWLQWPSHVQKTLFYSVQSLAPWFFVCDVLWALGGGNPPKKSTCPIYCWVLYSHLLYVFWPVMSLYINYCTL